MEGGEIEDLLVVVLEEPKKKLETERGSVSHKNLHWRLDAVRI